MTADEPEWKQVWAKRQETVIKRLMTENGMSREDAEAYAKQIDAGLLQDLERDPRLQKAFTDEERDPRLHRAFTDMLTKRAETRTADDLLRGMHQLTHDDLIDMWQKAQALPEPDRTKALRQITHLSTQFESKPAQLLVDIILEAL